MLFIFVGKLNSAGYILGVVSLLVPVIFILLHIFVAVLQAFVFTILPVIYVSGAVAEEHNSLQLRHCRRFSVIPAARG